VLSPSLHRFYGHSYRAIAPGGAQGGSGPDHFHAPLALLNDSEKPLADDARGRKGEATRTCVIEQLMCHFPLSWDANLHKK
jgi:hypothetical protein